MAVIDVAPLSAAPESPQSAVSWGAIFAGAAVAAAVSLMLIILGAGFGFAVVSPWAPSTLTAGGVAISAAIWLVVVQWVASGFGGYVTGRLRTQWVGVHTDEVFFRDTAHGFVAWCVATLLVAALTASTLSGMVSTGVQATSNVLSGAAQGASQGAVQAASGSNPAAYFADILFRPAADRLPAATPPAANGTDSRAEAVRILVADTASGTWPDADKAYLAQMVAAQTGLSADDATKRVNDVLGQIDAVKAKAKDAADAARKAGLTMTVLAFLSLLVGAFIASVAAALAGRLRDEDVPWTT